jgi:competence protein ComEA
MLKQLTLVLLLGLIPAFTPLYLHAAEIAVASQVQVVNINHADAATLAAKLNGVGLSRAEEIVRYRENYGPFLHIDDLLQVRGIGQATIDKNRDRISLD